MKQWDEEAMTNQDTLQSLLDDALVALQTIYWGASTMKPQEIYSVAENAIYRINNLLALKSTSPSHVLLPRETVDKIRQMIIDFKNEGEAFGIVHLINASDKALSQLTKAMECKSHE